jgi:gamma-glutamylcyclotransferase (GGCT)/AIG2-like uncharacterized protein YtfP
MDAEPRHLFVYGTLMSGFRNPYGAVLRTRGRLLGAASVQGELYCLGAYPGLIVADDACGRVFGELYEIGNGGAVLPHLDRFEGLFDPEPQPFARRVAPATLHTGARFPAWVYVYLGPVSGRVRLSSGRFARRA